MRHINLYALLFTILTLSGFLFSTQNPAAVRPVIYIPGMYDNGNRLNSEHPLVRSIEDTSGSFTEELTCGINPDAGSSLRSCRLAVANMIGPEPVTFDIESASRLFFAWIFGPDFSPTHFRNLKKIKGNTCTGTLTRNGTSYQFNGLLAEVWGRYGSKVYVSKDGRILTGKAYTHARSAGKNGNTDFYTNAHHLYADPDEILFTIITHSTGGLLLRSFFEEARLKKTHHHTAEAVFLAVPHHGARCVMQMQATTYWILDFGSSAVIQKRRTGSTFVQLPDSNPVHVSYEDILSGTLLGKVYGNSFSAVNYRNFLSKIIFYFIPFDGKSGRLYRDKGLRGLHPHSSFVRKLSNAPLPSDVNLVNVRSLSPSSALFENLGKCFFQYQGDGAVDYRDADMYGLKGINMSEITDLTVTNCDHLHFPYIGTLVHLEETLRRYYPFLKILAPGGKTRIEKETLTAALFKALMQEMGIVTPEVFNMDHSIIKWYGNKMLSEK